MEIGNWELGVGDWELTREAATSRSSVAVLPEKIHDWDPARSAASARCVSTICPAALRMVQLTVIGRASANVRVSKDY